MHRKRSPLSAPSVSVDCLKIRFWIFNMESFQCLFLSVWLNNSKRTPSCSHLQHHVCFVCVSRMFVWMHACMCAHEHIVTESADRERSYQLNGNTRFGLSQSAPTPTYQRRLAEEIISSFAWSRPACRSVKLRGEEKLICPSGSGIFRIIPTSTEMRGKAWTATFLPLLGTRFHIMLVSPPRVLNLFMKRSVFE